MDAHTVVDFFQSWMWTGLMLASPILLSGVVIGLAIALFQALTQVQEQTIATVLKIMVMIMVAGFTLHWMSMIMVERATDVFHTIPRVVPAN